MEKNIQSDKRKAKIVNLPGTYAYLDYAYLDHFNWGIKYSYNFPQSLHYFLALVVYTRCKLNYLHY